MWEGGLITDVESLPWEPHSGAAWLGRHYGLIGIITLEPSLYSQHWGTDLYSYTHTDTLSLCPPLAVLTITSTFVLQHTGRAESGHNNIFAMIWMLFWHFCGDRWHQGVGAAEKGQAVGHIRWRTLKCAPNTVCSILSKVVGTVVHLAKAPYHEWATWALGTQVWGQPRPFSSPN